MDKVLCFVGKSWAVEKEALFNVSKSKAQLQIRLRISHKLYVYSYSLKWLSPTQRRVRRKSLSGFLTLKTMSLWGLMKLVTKLVTKIYFANTI